MDMKATSLSPLDGNMYYAHTSGATGEWQPLSEHLHAVAKTARAFAEPFGAGEVAYWVGLLHDIMNRFSVAGFQYYSGPKLIDRLHPGVQLDLVAKPENAYDNYAVRIEWQGHKLDYVLRSDNRHISRLLHQGAKLSCRVLKAQSDTVPWRMLEVG